MEYVYLMYLLDGIDTLAGVYRAWSMCIWCIYWMVLILWLGRIDSIEHGLCMHILNCNNVCKSASLYIGMWVEVRCRVKMIQTDDSFLSFQCFFSFFSRQVDYDAFKGKLWFEKTDSIPLRPFEINSLTLEYVAIILLGVVLVQAKRSILNPSGHRDRDFLQTVCYCTWRKLNICSGILLCVVLEVHGMK